jgi:hypothetical protein
MIQTRLRLYAILSVAAIAVATALVIIIRAVFPGSTGDGTAAGVLPVGPTQGAAIGVAMPGPMALTATARLDISTTADTSTAPWAVGTVDDYPGDVVTLVRDPAAFAQMGGVIVTDGIAYVATDTSVLKVDLTTKVVSTLAGSSSHTGCVAGTDPTAVRFEGPPGDLAFDGTDLYLSDGCGISKISASTGATSRLEPWSGALSIGPDDQLFVARNDEPSTILRVNTSNGTAQPYVVFPDESLVLGLAADEQSLWVAVDEGSTAPIVVARVTFADATITRFASPGIDVVGAGQLASAGLYLYAPSVGNAGVLRFTKSNGAWGLLAGGYHGDRDGAFHLAKFGYVQGIAAAGSTGYLWITDRENHALRRIEFSQEMAFHIGG